jgi:hypothetical protein
LAETPIIAVRLEERVANPPLRLLDAARAQTLDSRGFVEKIAWGWKRDSVHPSISRMIFFGGRHVRRPDGTWLEHPFLFYDHSGPVDALQPVADQLTGPRRPTRFSAQTDFLVTRPSAGTLRVNIVSGTPSATDLLCVRRLASREPDPPDVTPPTVESSQVFDLRAHGVSSCDVLAGSGVGYESGLPMLKQVHDLFCVDEGYERFCLGDSDPMPGLLWHDLEGMFIRFSSWHVLASEARPSSSHKCLAALRSSGLVQRVFTDNVDQLFRVAGFEDCVQVRGLGVVNDVFDVAFHPASDALLVIGVSADRRGIIRQARERGLKIIVINPYIPVSPGAKNLDYLRRGDIYFRLTAGVALPRIVATTVGRAAVTFGAG